ncbi:hypothetical protein ACQYWQ_23805 [Streptomyces sp. P6-2-1]|uniref:hypothetical protein n=1 Tax=Streptomyces sp. P6-2-1 TaxID=3422591 RepID=UPI003D3672D4
MTALPAYIGGEGEAPAVARVMPLVEAHTAERARRDADAYPAFPAYLAFLAAPWRRWPPSPPSQLPWGRQGPVSVPRSPGRFISATRRAI